MCNFQNQFLLFVHTFVIVATAIRVIPRRFAACTAITVLLGNRLLFTRNFSFKLIARELSQLGLFLESREHVKQNGLMGNLEKLKEDIVRLDCGCIRYRVVANCSAYCLTRWCTGETTAEFDEELFQLGLAWII